MLPQISVEALRSVKLKNTSVLKGTCSNQAVPSQSEVNFYGALRKRTAVKLNSSINKSSPKSTITSPKHQCVSSSRDDKENHMQSA